MKPHMPAILIAGIHWLQSDTCYARLNENNSGSMDCGCFNRHPRHCGLGTRFWFILTPTAHWSCDSERLPPPDENQTRAVQSRLHQVSAPTPSRTAHRLWPQSTNAIRPSIAGRKLVKWQQPHRPHHRQSIDQAIAPALQHLPSRIRSAQTSDARYKIRPLLCSLFSGGRPEWLRRRHERHEIHDHHRRVECHGHTGFASSCREGYFPVRQRWVQHTFFEQVYWETSCQSSSVTLIKTKTLLTN